MARRRRPRDAADPPLAPDTHSLFSRFFFLYISPVLSRGLANGGLGQDDLPLLSRSDHPGRLVGAFLRSAGAGVAAGAGAAGAAKARSASAGVAASAGAAGAAEARSASAGGLFSALLRQYAARYAFSGACLLATNASALAVPLTLGALLSHLDSSGGGGGGFDGHAYALAAALAAASAGQALVIHRFWFDASIVGVHSEVILSTLVYAKALSLSPAAAAAGGFTRGRLTNAMAVDACRLNETWVFPFLHWNTWSAALTVGVAVVSLHALLGPAGLAGCALMVLFVPATTLATRAAMRYADAIQRARDARAALVADAVAGAATLKVYGWAAWFLARIAAAREVEMRPMRAKQALGVVGDFVGTLAPLAVMAVAFGCFTALSPPGSRLTASVAFSSMAWFDQLRQPLRSIPNTITTAVDARVSLGRIADLLNADDVDVGGLDEWARRLAGGDGGARAEGGGDGGAGGAAPGQQRAVPMRSWLDPNALVRGLDVGARRRRRRRRAPAESSGGGGDAGRESERAVPLLDAEADRAGATDGGASDSENEEGGEFEDDDCGEDEPGGAEWLSGATGAGGAAADGPAVELVNASFGWFDVEGGGGTSTPAAPPAASPAASSSSVAPPAASPAASPPIAAGAGLRVVLSGVTLSLPRGGSLTLVLGPVGAGKSTLLAGLVGDASRAAGSARVAGAVAYAGQTPWVLNRSVRENVTFVSPWRPGWYAVVMAAVGLDADAAAWPARDETVVGDAGVTLSGGQRARLALARALYADADVYVLDDVLSAVDARVGGHVWRETLVALLRARGKTVLLATHAAHYAAWPEVDCVVELDGAGGVRRVGPPAAVAVDAATEAVAGGAATTAAGGATTAAGAAAAAAAAAAGAAASAAAGGAAARGPRERAPAAGAPAAERSARGALAAGALRQFLLAMGPPPLLVSLAGLYVVTQALVVGTTWWLAQWVEATNGGDGSGGSGGGGSPSPDPAAAAAVAQRYAGGYAALNAAVAVASLARMGLLAAGTLRAGTALHNGAAAAVLAAPASFFAATPAGRVVSRFTADVATVDNTLRFSISLLAQQVFAGVGILAVVLGTTPAALAPLAGLSYLYYTLAQRYRVSARDMRRLQSTARSPVLSHLAESLRGAAVIRAHGPRAATAFVRRHLEVSAVHLRAWLAYWAANEFISCALEVVGAAVILAAALLAVYEHGRGALSTGAVGLTLTFNLQIPAVLMWLVRAFSQVETDAVAVERLVEYTAIPSEEDESAAAADAADAAAAADAKADAEGAAAAVGDTPEGGESAAPAPAPATATAKAPAPAPAPATAPAADAPPPPVLELTGVVLRYGGAGSAGAPALAGVDLALPAGSKLAVVGRTGAGKSSLLQAVLRLYPTQAGAIRVGGVDVATRSRVPCAAARLRVTALLQDPFLFGGTLRENLAGPGAEAVAVASGGGGSGAPALAVSDAVLTAALADVGLPRQRVNGLAADLDMLIADGGSNLSAGERALLSLARALARVRAAAAAAGPAGALLVADEPTAAVDAVADATVQAALRASPAAVLCVCHRLAHVHAYDAVAVVDAGRVVEVGPPALLAARPGGRFAALLAAAEASGEAAGATLA